MLRKIILTGALLTMSIFIGVYYGTIEAGDAEAFDVTSSRLDTESLIDGIYGLEDSFFELLSATDNLSESALVSVEEQTAQMEKLAELAEKSADNKNLSEEVYEDMIVARLGEPIEVIEGTNSTVQIFELEQADLRGYMAKVTLKTDDALEVVIADDDVYGQTTLSAANETGAILAINAGGFSEGTVNGITKLVALGNTMIDGELINSFIPTWNDVSFIGFTEDGELVGGMYETEQELIDSGAYQGVSFVPQLISDWEAVEIPSKWQNTKQPRTVVGQYPNGDLIFIVVDGRQSDWSDGITLEEMQILLLELGVMEAYNLDGGGSSTFVFDGEVLNKPSDGYNRTVSTNIVIFE